MRGGEGREGEGREELQVSLAGKLVQTSIPPPICVRNELEAGEGGGLLNCDLLTRPWEFYINVILYPSLETQEQLVGARKTGEKKIRANTKSQEREPGLFFAFLTFLRPFRLFPAPTNCPWVSEDVLYRVYMKRQISSPHVQLSSREAN